MASCPKIFRRLFICFFFPAVIAGCKNATQTAVEEAFPDGSPKTVVVYKVTAGKKAKSSEISYYPGGIIRYEGAFKNGQKHGKWIYYYENCNKWSLGYFSDGLSEGRITTWYKDGRKRYEGFFYKGKKTGKWRFWNEAGNLTKEESFE